ncbi:MAG: FecR domain-containing protein [Planctomycetota bacterium]|nr:FecR domain-containing protein [Planctomycetota bacterium]
MRQTMDCEAYWNLISARLDGEIRPEEKAQLESHLPDCATCRAVSDAFVQQDQGLRQAFAPRSAAVRRVADAALRQLPGSRPSGGRRRSRVSLLVAGAAGFAAAWLVAFLSGLVEFPVSGERGASAPTGLALALAIDPVEVKRPGGAAWEKLAPGDLIPAGARLRTGPASLAELRGTDGSTIRLNRSTEILVVGPRRYELARGQWWSEVARGDTPFEVQLENAVVAALGTRFDIAHEDGDTVVRVLAGATRVSVEGSAHIIRGGEMARISPAGALTRRRIDSIALASGWVHELLVLKGEENDELAGRLEELLASIGRAKMSKLYEDEIRALGTSCVRPLLSYVRSTRSLARPGERAHAAHIACDLAPKSAIRELIQLLADHQGDVRAAAARALERLTGIDRGLSEEDWKGHDWQRCEAGYVEWLAWLARDKEKSATPP